MTEVVLMGRRKSKLNRAGGLAVAFRVDKGKGVGGVIVVRVVVQGLPAGGAALAWLTWG